MCSSWSFLMVDSVVALTWWSSWMTVSIPNTGDHQRPQAKQESSQRGMMTTTRGTNCDHFVPSLWLETYLKTSGWSALNCPCKVLKSLCWLCFWACCFRSTLVICVSAGVTICPKACWISFLSSMLLKMYCFVQRHTCPAVKPFSGSHLYHMSLPTLSEQLFFTKFCWGDSTVERYH